MTPQSPPLATATEWHLQMDTFNANWNMPCLLQQPSLQMLTNLILHRMLWSAVSPTIPPSPACVHWHANTKHRNSYRFQKPPFQDIPSDCMEHLLPCSHTTTQMGHTTSNPQHNYEATHSPTTVSQ